MSQFPGLAEFVPLVGTRFLARGEAGEPVDLELIEAVALPRRAAPPGVREDPFSLRFRGPLSPGLPQRVHDLEHDALGAIPLFLVPNGPEGDPLGTHYQAIFN